MSQRGRERLGGIFILVVSVALTLLAWEQADRTGRFVVGGAIGGPMFAVLGLALLLIPSYRQERLARGEDLSTMKGSQLITPRWWAVLAIALVAGLADYVLLKYFSRQRPRAQLTVEIEAALLRLARGYSAGWSDQRR